MAKSPLIQQNPKSKSFTESFLKNKVTCAPQTTSPLLGPLCSHSRDKASDDAAHEISDFSVEVSN